MDLFPSLATQTQQKSDFLFLCHREKHCLFLRYQLVCAGKRNAANTTMVEHIHLMFNLIEIIGQGYHRHKKPDNFLDLLKRQLSRS
jgi:hypothetical protein